jgi:hypothetical protein
MLQFAVPPGYQRQQPIRRPKLGPWLGMHAGVTKPSISWAIPADVTFGTGLSATQLNASSSVAGKFAYSPIAGTVFPAGTHTLVVTFTPADATDYATATQSVQLKVNKAQLSVTANNLNMVYGAAIPRLTFIISGFVHGDTLNSSVTGAPGITTSATSKSAVGTYLVIPMAGTLSAANYSFTFKPGTLTVTKAVLTATATSVSATYNKPLPKLAYTVAGYLNGDTLSSVRDAPIETTTAKQGSLPGTYPITIAQGTLAATN